jgi:hypothetical protein
VKEEQPDFDWKKYGFQEFGELLNFAQDKSVVRVEPHEEKGLMVYLGAEFHPPAMPEPEPEQISDEQPTEEPQPTIAGQPIARVTKPRRPRRKAASATGESSARRPSRARRSTGPSRRPRPAPSDAQPTE